MLPVLRRLVLAPPCTLMDSMDGWSAAGWMAGWMGWMVGLAAWLPACLPAPAGLLACLPANVYTIYLHILIYKYMYMLVYPVRTKNHEND